MSKSSPSVRVIRYLALMFPLAACYNEPDQVPLVFECTELGLTEECTQGPTEGVCRRATRFCWGTEWDICRGEVLPSEETCDDLDNDCDGIVDENVLNSCGECGADPIEVCDGKDNNCNNLIDEGFSDVDEICDGIDNDCDFRVDEGWSKRFVCVPESIDRDWIVYDENSSCSEGWRECRNGSWTECFDWVGPEREICDGIDNDCDGVIDDLITREDCGVSDIGSCQYGTEFCVDKELICIDSINPQNEICDAIDNDCDGSIDEDLYRECSTVCSSGVEICVEGTWTNCSAQIPTEEICDGADNDCNGLVDENLECSCLEGATRPCLANPCGWGLQSCQDGMWSDCDGILSQPETCNNHDDNCNDQVDETLTTSCYQGPPETIDVGICHSGESVCDLGIWGPCRDQQMPEQERCDGIDNDCDGVLDNMDRVFDQVDLIFALDVSGSMDDYLEPLTEGISNYVTSLTDSEHKFGIVVFGHNDEHSVLGVGFGRVQIPLTDIGGFIQGLESLVVDGGSEPSLDTIQMIADASNPLSIGWRPEATPIIVLFGDEEAQSNLGLQAQDLIPMISVCQLPGCNSISNENWTDGDPLELFAFLPTMYFEPWLSILQGMRIFNIDRVTETRTLEIDLELLFSEVCID